MVSVSGIVPPLLLRPPGQPLRMPHTRPCRHPMEQAGAGRRGHPGRLRRDDQRV